MKRSAASRRTSRRSNGAARRAPVPPPPSPPVGLTEDNAGAPAPPLASGTGYVPSFRDYQYLHAVVELLEEGDAVTLRGLGAKLGISHVSVWKYQQANPAALRWVSEQFEQASRQLVGAVKRRMGEIGLRGSVDHAKLFLQTSGELVDRHSHDHKGKVQMDWLELVKGAQ